MLAVPSSISPEDVNEMQMHDGCSDSGSKMTAVAVGTIVFGHPSGSDMGSPDIACAKVSEEPDSLHVPTAPTSPSAMSLTRGPSGRNTPSGATLRVYLQSLEEDHDETQLLSMPMYVTIIALLAFTIAVATQVFCYMHWIEDDSALDLSFSKVFGPGYESDRRVVSPTSHFRAIDFARYCTLFQWVTCVLCGLGGEAVFGQYMVKQVSDEGGKALYMMAQLAFSLFLSVAFFATSAFGLPFLVVGLWKAGFPETLGYFVRARNLGFGRKWPTVDCITAFFNGMGTLLHHAAAAYIVCSCNTKLCPLQRDTLATCLPTIMQHWFCLTRYTLPIWLYALIQGVLEVLFEWEVFAALPYVGPAAGYDRSLRGVGLSMVIAHWFYWAASLLSPLAGKVDKDLLSFHRIDADRSGSLDFDEFCKAMATLGVDLTEHELLQVFREIDADDSGTVTLEEFAGWMKSHDIREAAADQEVVEWRQMAVRNGSMRMKRA